MCIIVYKPENTQMPSKKTLKNCWNNNDDGAGYMFPLDNRVIIKKGFMTFKDFWKSLRVDYEKFPTLPFVLHFRITTQGGVRPELTHPYPMSKNMEDLKLLRTTSNTFGVAHNGIISLTSTNYNTTITYNDTMKFITDYLSLIVKSPKSLENDDTLKLIERLAGSKLAIMDTTGKVTLIGTFNQNKGCFYSNYTYNYDAYSTTTYYQSYTGIHHYDDDDDFWAETCQVTKGGKYVFDPDSCPRCISGNNTYCENCIYNKYCNEESSSDEI